MVPQKAKGGIYRAAQGSVHVLVQTRCLGRGCILCANVDRDAVGEPNDWAVQWLGIL